MFPTGKTVVVVHRTIVRDAVGNETITETGQTSHDNVAVAPRPAEPQGELAEQVSRSRTLLVSGLTVFLPADAVVDADDRLEIDGELYEIDGLPTNWESPYTGWRPGMAVAARRVTG